jgi:hypothetical protein
LIIISSCKPESFEKEEKASPDQGFRAFFRKCKKGIDDKSGIASEAWQSYPKLSLRGA